MILKVGGVVLSPAGLSPTGSGSSATLNAYQQLPNESLCKTHHCTGLAVQLANPFNQFQLWRHDPPLSSHI